MKRVKQSLRLARAATQLLAQRWALPYESYLSPISALKSSPTQQARSTARRPPFLPHSSAALLHVPFLPRSAAAWPSPAPSIAPTLRGGTAIGQQVLPAALGRPAGPYELRHWPPADLSAGEGGSSVGPPIEPRELRHGALLRRRRQNPPPPAGREGEAIGARAGRNGGRQRPRGE
jgi:hypothetical protein